MGRLAEKYGHIAPVVTVPTSNRRAHFLTGGPRYLGPAVDLTPKDLSNYEGKGYIWQPKLDGCWCELRCLSGYNELWSRNGKQSFTDDVAALTNLKTGLRDTYLVGEIEYATEASTAMHAKLGYRRIWLYDLHRVSGKDLYHLRYGERWKLLQKLYRQFSPQVKKRLLLVDCGTKNFRKAYDAYCTQELMEGIVLKHLDSKGFDTANSSGKSSCFLRCKTTFTRDYVVLGWAYTPKQNITAVLGLWTGTGYKEVLRTPLPDMRVVNGKLNHEGKVVQCYGWGVGKSGSLRHGHFDRFRPDKKAKDCRC